MAFRLWNITLVYSSYCNLQAVVWVLWEPPTKQLYCRCQSSSDVPSSQSAQSIGPHLASWQGIEHCHLEHQSSVDSTVPLVQGVPADSGSSHAAAASTIQPTIEAANFLAPVNSESARASLAAGATLIRWPSLRPVPAVYGPFAVNTNMVQRSSLTPSTSDTVESTELWRSGWSSFIPCQLAGHGPMLRADWLDGRSHLSSERAPQIRQDCNLKKK
jgi:hypothetical protein